jgi:hypothetical protein
MADSFTKHLRERGFNAIALPTSSFGALSLVYEFHGRRGWSNDFEHLVQNQAAPPTVQGPTQEPDLSGKVVNKLEASGTLSVLGGLISALGGGTLGVKGGFEKASTITFEYGQVSMVQVSEAGLDAYLRAGTPPPKDSLLGKYLTDHLYVATRVLRSRSFTVSAQDSKGQAIGLDIPVIQNAVGAKVSVERSSSSDTKIVFKGDVDVSFAFQAFLVEQSGGKLSIKPTKAGTIETRKAINFDEVQGEDELRPTLIDADEALVLDTKSEHRVLDKAE